MLMVNFHNELLLFFFLVCGVGVQTQWLQTWALKTINFSVVINPTNFMSSFIKITYISEETESSFNITQPQHDNWIIF